MELTEPDASSADRYKKIIADFCAIDRLLVDLFLRFHKKRKKVRGRLEEVLDEFPTIDINQKSILNAYALIDAWTHGKHLDSTEHDFPPPKPAVSMSKNDLWIAATAYASNATLLSTDKDFAHLHDKWINFVYIDPEMSLPEN